ncbi:MAG: hydroxyethylthiazole kinase [Candidatus Omnitrophica bacterium]|nr:hydroxyethylthiazole kinase [Candidatus Omnitrophota bacterium]MDD5552272.1 hydroxyethylthiazole kinase [Candidatus Omnitrophota bacterium]
MAGKIKLDAYSLLAKIRQENPVVHHLTNWVTIYDCANITKVLGASPVMAHAQEESAEMASIASSLVLNIGTLTVDFVEAMKLAAKSANKKGIPVILDVCGAGATQLRDKKCLELLDETTINVVKGNASEIARVSGEKVLTRGVDTGHVSKDVITISRGLALRRGCTVVVTGREDTVTDGKEIYIIKNGHPMMTHVVGTGCMAASVIGAFCAVEKDLAYAAAAGLICFEIAAECAVKSSLGPGSFKERLFDCAFNLDKKTITKMQKVECSS